VSVITDSYDSRSCIPPNQHLPQKWTIGNACDQQRLQSYFLGNVWARALKTTLNVYVRTAREAELAAREKAHQLMMSHRRSKSQVRVVKS